METLLTTPTTAPKFRDAAIVATPINTEVKTTQAATFINYFVVADFELDFGYYVKQFNAGDRIAIDHSEQGYTMLDGYRCHLFNAVIVNGVRTETLFIPNELVKERHFAIVREYKTTTWEIIDWKKTS